MLALHITCPPSRIRWHFDSFGWLTAFSHAASVPLLADDRISRVFARSPHYRTPHLHPDHPYIAFDSIVRSPHSRPHVLVHHRILTTFAPNRIFARRFCTTLAYNRVLTALSCTPHYRTQLLLQILPYNRILALRALLIRACRSWPPILAFDRILAASLTLQILIRCPCHPMNQILLDFQLDHSLQQSCYGCFCSLSVISYATAATCSRIHSNFGRSRSKYSVEFW